MKGVGKLAAEKFIQGSKIIKKNNIKEHVNSSNTHAKAILRLKDDRTARGVERNDTVDLNVENDASTNKIIPEKAKQTTLTPYIQLMNARQKNQLLKKFQIAHFTVVNSKSFSFYGNLVKFTKEVLNVDTGKSYSYACAGSEIVNCLGKSVRLEKITEPLQQKKIRYYSILNDGSSSSKTNDEKELFFMKSACDGVPDYCLMSLEEPESTNAAGLQQALENSVLKLEVNFDRNEREIGMCSDGAAVNFALYNLLLEEIGEHYLHTWCPAHILELGIQDAFKISNMNTVCQEMCCKIYYLFKRATLRWRLFKRQSVFLGLTYKKLKRPFGSRWVEHQADNLNSHNSNLPILIGFFNQQISDPYNATIRKDKALFKGIKNEITNLDRLLYNGAKLDILTILLPLSKSFQENELLLPSLLSNTSYSIKTMEKLHRFLIKDGVDAIKNKNLFPSLAALLDKISTENEDIIPELQTRRAQLDNEGNNYVQFDTYLMKGNLDMQLQRVTVEITKIVGELARTLDERLKRFSDNPIFSAMSVFLDTQGYQYFESDDILENVNKIAEHFKKLLEANNCDLTRFTVEMQSLYEHINKFLKEKPPIKAWPYLFARSQELGISNILHIAEISLAVPTSNAELERNFSFLWRTFSKDRQSLTNNSLENSLRLRNDKDFRASSEL